MLYVFQVLNVLISIRHCREGDTLEYCPSTIRFRALLSAVPTQWACELLSWEHSLCDLEYVAAAVDCCGFIQKEL